MAKTSKTENLEDLIAEQTADLVAEGEETDVEVSDEALDELSEGFPTLAEVDAEDLDEDDDEDDDSEEDIGDDLENEEDLDDDVSLRPKHRKGGEWGRVSTWESVFNQF